MGASPDGINCACCGYEVLESKCPYSCRNTLLLEKSKESTFFLKKKDGELTLSVHHAYYFQVQAVKLFLLRLRCMEKEEFLVQRIYLDEPFITMALEKCKGFIMVWVLPELLAKFYSREP